MADDTVTLPGTGAKVAVDRVAGDDYQLIKLVDATEDSLTRTGVPDNPLTVDARMAFVDYDDSVVPVTDNDDNHWLPVTLRGTPDVAVAAFNTTAPVSSFPSETILTGPSNGTWGTDISTGGYPGMFMLTVRSTGGTPTIAAFAAATSGGGGGVYDQQLPLVVPNGDSLVLAETFTPGVGNRFCYILATVSWLEIRAVSGGTGTAVDATLTATAFQPPIVATVSSGGASGDTELPAAAALADAAANPTTPTVGAGNLLYNGSTWDRVRGDTTNGIDVDVTRVIPGTSATHLGKAEDAAHADGDTGVAVWAVRQSEVNSLTSSAGADGDYTALNSDARGLLQVVARPYVSRIQVASSGLSTGAAYAIGDTAGAIMTFAGCARVTGGTGTILSATLLDKGDVGVDYRLHIYRATVTLSADNAAWAVSDSDQESLLGIVTLPSMLDVGANRVATLANIGLPYDCAATSLFVGIETRTANAQYAAATDLHLILTVALD